VKFLVERDNLYNSHHQSVEQFRFDEHVSNVFSDMIHRSVPGYDLTLEMIGVIAREYGRPNSHCYDLGCSLGASTLAIRHNLTSDTCRILAIDNSAAMIEKCTGNIQKDSGTAPVEVVQQDILEVSFDNACMSVMNFTLQFIETSQRMSLLQRIASATPDGGVFILSEKIKHSDELEQQVLTDLHHQFKSTRGYSELEIAQKRSALEDVLIPDTLETHKNRLLEAGFSKVIVWFQCFTFVSLIAIK
jgi:tRNA (cmo5U34)-methyltransferase